MFHAIVFGLAFGAAFQAWRNFPADGPVTSDGLALVFAFGLLLAYLAGRGRRASSATAVASAVSVADADATATATNQVNIGLVFGANEGARPVGLTFPSEDSSWVDGERAAITADDLDGMDYADLLDGQQTTEGAP